MSINCDFEELIKDKNVRNILQKIHNEISISKADMPHVIAVIPSYTGRVELFNKDAPEENDIHFIRCLNDNDIITNINFKVRYPNKSTDEIDYSLLSKPEEFKTPYVAVSFDVLDKQFVNKLYNEAIDILVINPYPPEAQQDLVSTAIVKVKAQTQKDNIVLSWNEIDKEDVKHIGIMKTLQNLEADKQIRILIFDGNLDIQTDHGNTEFQAHILYTPIVPFTGKDILIYKTLALDPKSRNTFYPKLKKKSKITGFRTKNAYYRVLEGFLSKKGQKVLSYAEIYQLIHPNLKLPKYFERAEKRKIETLINSLKHKFNDLSLFKCLDDSYELTP